MSIIDNNPACTANWSDRMDIIKHIWEQTNINDEFKWIKSGNLDSNFLFAFEKLQNTARIMMPLPHYKGRNIWSL